jgi:hypothetical protein
MYCTHCGREIQSGWRACPACGTVVASTDQSGRDIGVAPAAPSASIGSDLSAYYDASWAVVIGVNNYLHHEVPDLEFAVADAQLMAQTLPQIGFPPERIITLLDDQATQRNIQMALSGEMVRQLGPNDRLLVFFSGHGQDMELPDGAKWGYLIPVDGDPDELHASCISMFEVAESWSKLIAAKHIMYVLDCCYSGLAGSRSTGLSHKNANWISTVTQRQVRQVMTAGRADQQAFEEAGHGIFTRALVRAVQGEADLEGRGFVTGQELGAYVRRRVLEDSRQQQDPLFRYLRGDGEFIFGMPGASIAFPAPPPPAAPTLFVSPQSPAPAPAPPMQPAPAASPPVSASFTGALDRDALAARLRRFDFVSQLSVFPEITAKQTKGARQGMRIPHSEELAAVIDFTAMGSVKEGVAFTPQALYYNNGDHGEPPGPNRIEYATLADMNIQRKESFSGVVQLDAQHSFLTHADVQATLAMLSTVQALSLGRPGPCPACGLDDQFDGEQCGHCRTWPEYVATEEHVAVPKELLIGVLSDARSDGVPLDLYPDLPRKKLHNAFTRFNVPQGEQLVALHDSNVFSKSMKNGMAFGCYGVYFDRGDFLHTDGPNYIAYRDFPHRLFKPLPFGRIEMGGNMNYMLLKQVAAVRALNRIKELVATGRC